MTEPADCAVAIDIGATKIAAAVVMASGDVQDRRTLRTPAAAAVVLDAVVEVARDLVATAREVGRNPTAIGIGSAGQIDVARGSVLFATGTMPGWSGTRVAEIVQAATGLRVAIDNDGNAFALGEAWLGAGKQFGSVVGVVVGTGIGGGVVVGDQTWPGAHFWAGNVGHVRVAFPGLPCNCGGSGCLETLAAGWGIASRAAASLGQPPEHAAWTAKLVSERAHDGDAAACALIEEAGQFLGQVLANIAVVLDPGCFVIGGSVALGAPLLLDASRRAYRESIRLPGLADTPIEAAALTGDAVLIGAARLALRT